MVKTLRRNNMVEILRPNQGMKLHSVFLLALVILMTGMIIVINLTDNGTSRYSIQYFLPSSSSSSSTAALKSTSALATKESLGFFTDITDVAWKRFKQRFQLTQPNYNTQNPTELERHSRYSNHFWANNFEPEFTCAHEFRMGKLGDGGKWVCDPHRIMADNGDGKYPSSAGKCLVYSIGSNGNFEFEVEILKYVSPNCEIHTFDAEKQLGRKDFAKEAEKINGVTFHHTGLGPTSDRRSHFRRFREIIKDLNHENRVVDLMKIDCERCEYEQFRQWLEDWNEMGVLVRQVMLEVHNSDMPHVVDLFNDFQKAGFVLFHKEANYMCEGKAVEVAWIQMGKEFQTALM